MANASSSGLQLLSRPSEIICGYICPVVYSVLFDIFLVKLVR